jgi:hypothetical protein
MLKRLHFRCRFSAVLSAVIGRAAISKSGTASIILIFDQGQIPYGKGYIAQPSGIPARG